MNDDSIPVAVVGAGNMGSNHVRVYDELPGANLTEVVEPDPKQASAVREEYGDTVHDSIEDIEIAEAVTIATPNHLHREIATTLADRGFDLLVEKPLATTVEAAEAIVAAAEDNDIILQVGHIERFNPAVQTLGEILEEQDLIAFDAHRLGPFNEHLTDESVVFDLMIHDIDVIRSLVDSPVDHVDAVGAQPRSRDLDHAVAHLQFGNGVLGTMTSSHVTHSKVRTLTVTTDEMFVELDYQRQHITITRRGTEETTFLQGQSGYRTEILQETPFVHTREPLKNELESFLDSVRTRKRPDIDGTDAVEAIRLAVNIVDVIDSN